MTERARVLLTVALPEDLVGRLRDHFEVERLAPSAVTAADPAAFNAALATVDGALISQPVPITGPLLDTCPRLRVLSKTGVGYERIDVPAATAHRVIVCNTPGVLDGTVADHTFALMLALVRKLRAQEQHVRSGAWASGSGPYGTDLRGKTLGLIGLGGIGRVVARTAKGFDMAVLYYKPSRDREAESAGLAEYRERDDLLREADLVSLHVPLNDSTRKSIGARELGLMKPGASLVNTSRGAVVDEAALLEALRDGKIAGAALDVFEKEPLDPAHPFCALENAVLTPHIGSGTVDARRAMHELAVRNLVKGMAGQRPDTPLNWPG